MGFWHVLRLNPQTAKGAVVMSTTTMHWNIASFADTAIEIQRHNR
jgi:hypothetical protein